MKENEHACSDDEVIYVVCHEQPLVIEASS